MPPVNRAPLVQLPPELAPPSAARSTSAGVNGANAAQGSTDGGGAGARFLLGIDGGATKTLAAVLDVEAGSLHLGHGGPSNQDAVGAEAATQALLDAADEAIAGAGTSIDGLDAAVLAVAGTDTDAIVCEVRAHRPPEWIVVNDVVAAWATATGGEPGVGAISGTGSNVFGIGYDGRAWRTGGWGHIAGDEGSGYWLGLESIKATLRDRDGSGPETALSDAAVEFFDAPSVEALGAMVYSKPLSKSEIAAFAIETALWAERGDGVARELYEDGARWLGGQIAAVIAQTGLRGDFPVGLIGSAYKAGEIFVDPLTREIHEVAPGARVATVEMAPVGGSLLLAARACGAEGSLDRARLAKLLDETL
jgi:N-acetylglucosamine kinase-like BadF-type ATPase